MKKVYQAPYTGLFGMEAEGDLLTNSVMSVESMGTLDGSWEEDDEL